MRNRCTLIGSLIMVLVLAFALTETVKAQDAPRMDVQQLKEMLDDPDLVIIDVRKPRDMVASDLKIKGAVRLDTAKTGEWFSGFDRRKIYVLYCA
jgi:rhodanese-related sulfurtransferase